MTTNGASRWIKIGTVYRGEREASPLYIAGTSCTRAVCHVLWAGRSDLFWWQFASWSQFYAALRRRLAAHRLRWELPLPVFEESGAYCGVWVLVRRDLRGTISADRKAAEN